jgi:hypothetical protein
MKRSRRCGRGWPCFRRKTPHSREPWLCSSVMAELAEERQAIAAGVRGVGLRAVLFEEFGGRDADPEEALPRRG